MTDKEKVLRLLSDGKPHTHLQGYALNVMLHSRVSDLRRDGYRIRCWREGRLSVYQMDLDYSPAPEPVPEPEPAPSQLFTVPRGAYENEAA